MLPISIGERFITLTGSLTMKAFVDGVLARMFYFLFFAFLNYSLHRIINRIFFFEKDVLSLAIIESKILHMASFSSSGCGQKSSRSKVYWMTKTLLVKALTCGNLQARVIRPRVTSVRILESDFIKVNPLRSGLSVRNWIICWSKGCDRNK